MGLANIGHQQDMLEHGAQRELQVLPRRLRASVLSVDDLALLGDLDHRVRRARGLGEDRLVRGSAPTTDGPAAAMEDSEPTAMTGNDRGDGFVRAVERPGG